MTRHIGIQHRVKATAEGKAHPTRVAVRLEDGSVSTLELKNEDEELAFISTKLKRGDTIAMVLGGSGDCLAYAASRLINELGGEVLRVPPFILHKERGKDDKKNDAILLANLATEKQKFFYPVFDADRDIILVREKYRYWLDAQKARIACELRLRQRSIGGVYTHADGVFPEGGIKKYFDSMKASDTIFVTLVEEEKRLMADLGRTVTGTDVYKRIFEPVAGVGPSIAARLISAIIDIRRFEKRDQLRAFCGLQPKNGVFQRRRSGSVANWHNDARAAFYLFADQANRRPDSVWGKKLLLNKAGIMAAKCELFPEFTDDIRTGKGLEIDGKLRWYRGHIHKTALWRTATHFCDHIFRQWWDLVDEVPIARKKVA